MSKNLKPFIPSWLDEAGLSQPEFRLYCHLCRRADNITGIAWPSVDGREENGVLKETAIISVCGMSRRTAWKVIQSLINKKFIEKLGRGNFGSSNRYKILAPIGANEAPNDESPIVSNGAPNDESPIDAIEAPSFGANEHLLLTQSRPPEGNPKKDIQLRKSNKRAKSLGGELSAADTVVHFWNNCIDLESPVWSYFLAFNTGFHRTLSNRRRTVALDSLRASTPHAQGEPAFATTDYFRLDK